jgi:hypothetical protein
MLNTIILANKNTKYKNEFVPKELIATEYKPKKTIDYTPKKPIIDYTPKYIADYKSIQPISEYRPIQPIQDKPTPIQDKPTPIQDKPTPIQDKPIPIQDKPIPIQDKPIPIQDKPIPIQDRIKQEETIEQIPDNFKTIYIVTAITGGGSKKYLDDITSHYINTPFVYIKTKKQLLTTVFLPSDILFIQHLLFTDIFPNDLNLIKKKYNVKTIISIHDFYWFIPNITDISQLLHKLQEVDQHCEQIYLNPPDSIHPSIITLFNDASIVIHPSSFTKNNFDTFFRKDNTIIQPHNDIKIDYTTKRIPKIGKQINIGHFQNFTPCKGSTFINLLREKYKKYKKYRINFLILEENINSYTESNWYDEIIKNNFHCLLHLNMYGETYSYSLSKSINSGLPILYNNIGAFRERIPEKDHYIKVYESEYEMTNYTTLYTQFEKMLDYIIANSGSDITNSNMEIEYKDLYNYIFDDTLSIPMNSILHDKIKPFAIYFPQFHVIPENDKNYYNGMTDIVQLNHYIRHYKLPNEIIDSPSLEELSIKHLLDYKLNNKEIVNKQIDIAKRFSIYGFACYYYWFSTNSITNKNTIFENCYNLFFEEPTDFKIYFIWANENWSNNLAFNVKSEKIVNVYNFDNFMKNINHLMQYFKHPNYYKIENKPVFSIHHPWCIPEDYLPIFNYMLTTECIKNGFDGVVLTMNNMLYEKSSNVTYNFSPSYKGYESTNYKEYTNTIIQQQLQNNSINTIFFNFNNSVRFAIPHRTDCITKFTNTTMYNQDYLVNIILNKYKTKTMKTEHDQILLINSWNEWGENMAIEPGEINKTKYLSLIKSNLLSFLSNMS